MPTPFNDLTYDLAQKLVAKPDGYDEAYALLYEGDHFRKGAGFLGPTGDGGPTGAGGQAPAPVATLVTSRLETIFTPDDLLSEVVERRVAGVLGRAPRWRYQVRRPLEAGAEPTPEEQVRLDEMEALRAWAVERDLVGALRDWVRAASAFGRAYLRPYVPAGRLEGGTLPGVETAADALRHVFLEVVLPARAAVASDVRTRYEAGVVLFGEEEDVLGQAVPAHAELSFLDPDTEEGPDDYAAPLTVLAHVGGDDEDEVALPLRGRLLLHALEEPAPFVSRAMRQQQAALNTASTEMRIVNDDASFPVRLLLGAMPPGTWEEVTGAEGKKAWTFKPSSYQISPSSIVHVQGSMVPDGEATAATGSPVAKDILKPSAATFEAASVAPYKAEMDERREAILRRAKQLYVAITGDAASSGEARAQSLSDYLGDALQLAEALNPRCGALLEQVWDLALHLAGDPARDYDLEVEFTCRVQAPRASPAEQQASLRLLGEGVWSRARTMAFNGVDDPEAEIEAVTQERADAEAALDRAFLGATAGADGPEDEPAAEPTAEEEA